MQVFTGRAQEYHLAGYPDWMARLLHARGVDTPEQASRFLEPVLTDLHDPGLLHGMTDAVAIITRLGRQKARAVVYGDYDVDGLCASVIAQETLKAMGLKTIVYIPDRHTEGYGLNEDAIRQLAAQAELLLTVDCGITAVNEVALAKQLGMHIIITDHHTPPDNLPAADAVINSMLGAYPFASLCGTGTVWKLSLALKGMDFAKDQLDLAALATVADMVPLLGENRVIAAYGLKALAATRRIGLRALTEACGLTWGEALTSDKLSFGLAPRLNAGGRLTTAQDALHLLQSTRSDEAYSLAQKLNQVNAQRQAMEREVIMAAEKLLDGEDLLHASTVVVCGQGWNSGVVGLAAGRLAERYGYPAVVLTQQGEQCTGSGRSAGGIDLYCALKSCEDLFTRFGGHQQAAGLTLPFQNMAAFRLRFDQAVRDQLQGRVLLPQVPYDTRMRLSQVSIENVQALERLAPFGIGNPTPAFLMEDLALASSRAVGAENKHLKCVFTQENVMCDGIAFGMGDQQACLPPTIDAVVRLSLNVFRGNVSAQCQVSAIKAGKEAFAFDGDAQLAAILQDFMDIASNKAKAPARFKQVKAVTGLQGSLLVCRTIAAARAMHAKYPDFDTAQGPYSDRRAANCILYRTPLAQVRAPYELLVFCEGLLHDQEAAYAASLFPGAKLCAYQRTDELEQMIGQLKLTKEELREVYRLLRQSAGMQDLPWHKAKIQAALYVLEELELISLKGDEVCLLPMRKTDPQDSALFCILQ